MEIYSNKEDKILGSCENYGTLTKIKKIIHINTTFQTFSWDLWICVIGATIFCGIVIAICSFLSPDGWRGRYIQRRNPKEIKHRATKSKLNYHNAGWFAIASVMSMASDKMV